MKMGIHRCQKATLSLKGNRLGVAGFLKTYIILYSILENGTTFEIRLSNKA